MKSTTTGLRNSFSATISKRPDVTPMFADRILKAFYIISFLLINASCGKFTIRHDTSITGAAWPQIGRTPQHTNYTEETVEFPLELLWSHRAQSAIGASLITAENLVIFGTLNGRIEGVRLDSGKRSGGIKIKGNHAATCAYVDRSILLLRRRGQPALERYDLIAGRPMWNNKFAGSFCEPLIVENRVSGPENFPTSCTPAPPLPTDCCFSEMIMDLFSPFPVQTGQNGNSGQRDYSKPLPQFVIPPSI
jgi:hypothetical protein